MIHAGLQWLRDIGVGSELMVRKVAVESEAN
jgi:hypothetical protein